MSDVFDKLIPIFRNVFDDDELIIVETTKAEDIDEWDSWKVDLEQLVIDNDILFLDGTFYKNGELKRDMSEIPHPFVEESIELFSELSEEDKAKVHFIHFNHTNPLLIEGSTAQREIFKKG